MRVSLKIVMHVKHICFEILIRSVKSEFVVINICGYFITKTLHEPVVRLIINTINLPKNYTFPFRLRKKDN